MIVAVVFLLGDISPKPRDPNDSVSGPGNSTDGRDLNVRRRYERFTPPSAASTPDDIVCNKRGLVLEGA